MRRSFWTWLPQSHPKSLLRLRMLLSTLPNSATPSPGWNSARTKRGHHASIKATAALWSYTLSPFASSRLLPERCQASRIRSSRSLSPCPCSITRRISG